MKRFLKSKGGQDLQEHAISALSNLGAARSNVGFLVRDGSSSSSGDDDGNGDAVDAIVNAMGQYSECSIVQAKGCSAITNLASHDDSKLRLEIMNKGVGLAILYSSMAMHADDSTVQEAALKAVRNLCTDCETNQAKFIDIGVIDLVISAMDRHKDVPGLQEAGACVISILADYHNDTRILIGDNHGIDTILRAITVHLKHAGVVEWCNRALLTLTFDRHNAASCLEKTVDDDLPPAITVVIDAMMAHENVASIQEIGCATLANLANLGTDTSSSNLGVDPVQTKMYIVDGGTLDAITMAMVLHRNESRVQERACTLLLHLAIEDNHAAILAAIGIDMQLVKDAAKNFPDQCKKPANNLIRLLGVNR
ncbi:ARM repeat-containing protein [Fragilariopsis cylindrus CCMP1102]|uniref:ARM repeat-containing protein n=1 Tax=Fragilariopsis cylindrus CCMP1102 TaxID=635003 RepID=A0A1E7FV32_9STRA|nr:ARM repeat-containing protein [Fragilariopsis cylindrus CCMP1102]|eukprot:OEU22010.1 ARM repeat-containing protein [Fragilariopsis cylindrus CCMP1102]